MSDAFSSQPESNTSPQSSSGIRWKWGPLSAIVIVVFSYFAAQIFGGFLLSIYPYIQHWNTSRANEWLNNSVVAQFMYVLLSESLTLLTLWFFVRRRATAKMLGLVRPHWRDAGYVLIGIAAYFSLYIVAVNIVSSLTSLNVSQQQNIGFNNVAGGMALTMTFFSLVVLPPIVEEITFRGFLYGGLRRRFSPLLATLGASLLFAIPHLLEGNSGQGLLWIGGLDTFTLSLVLCYLRERTGRLWASMGVHATKNGIAFISLFIVHVR